MFREKDSSSYLTVGKIKPCSEKKRCKILQENCHRGAYSFIITTYLGHVTSFESASRIRTFLKNPDTKYDLDILRAIGCDGTIIKYGIKIWRY